VAASTNLAFNPGFAVVSATHFLTQASSYWNRLGSFVQSKISLKVKV